ncbi:MAG: class I SAM-dependent methyltransferase [Desulfobaccales bacterium]
MMAAQGCTKVYQNEGNLPLLELIAPKNGHALDLGCGSGDNARLLKLKGWKVTGITISPIEQEMAEMHCDEVYLADLDQGLPGSLKGPFDLVVMSHILEHLKYPGRILKEIKGLLTYDGIIAVALPNVLHYKNRFRCFLGYFSYEDGGIMDNTHLHFYTFESGVDLLSSVGYKILVAQAEGGFPFWKLKIIFPLKFINKVNRFSCKIFPGLFGYQSLYIAKIALE